MQYSWQVAIQSWCFRDVKDNRVVAQGIRSCGVDAVEISGAHVDFRNPDSFGGVVAAYRQYGIFIPTIGACHLSGDEKTDRGYFEFAQKASAKAISISFSFPSYPGILTYAERLADEYGVHLAIHNHGCADWLGTSAVLGHIFSLTTPKIGLCLDTAWAMDSGENPVKMVERFRDRLRTVHVKDFVYDRSGRNEDVIPGEGSLDLAGLLETLRNTGFAGNLVIEYEGDRHNPLPSLQKCAQRVLSLLAEL